jgi:hypothetical protein
MVNNEPAAAVNHDAFVSVALTASDIMGLT